MYSREFRVEVGLYKAVSSFIEKYADNICKYTKQRERWLLESTLTFVVQVSNMILWPHYFLVVEYHALIELRGRECPPTPPLGNSNLLI